MRFLPWNRNSTMARFDIVLARPEFNVYVCDPFRLSSQRREWVEAIWQGELRKRKALLYDGKLLEFAGIRGSRLTGRFVSYKEYVASRKNPAILGRVIVPLAVSGITWLGDYVGFGERGARVRNYPGRLELFPSGSIDESCLRANRRIDFHAQLIDELWEETGICKSHVVATNTRALIR